ncbi:MAG: hypothetical protein R3F40_10740 [Candidatus Competibacteraceae bacterium]
MFGEGRRPPPATGYIVEGAAVDGAAAEGTTPVPSPPDNTIDPGASRSETALPGSRTAGRRHPGAER